MITRCFADPSKDTRGDTHTVKEKAELDDGLMCVLIHVLIHVLGTTCSCHAVLLLSLCPDIWCILCPLLLCLHEESHSSWPLPPIPILLALSILAFSSFRAHRVSVFSLKIIPQLQNRLLFLLLLRGKGNRKEKSCRSFPRACVSDTYTHKSLAQLNLHTNPPFSFSKRRKYWCQWWWLWSWLLLLFFPLLCSKWIIRHCHPMGRRRHHICIAVIVAVVVIIIVSGDQWAWGVCVCVCPCHLDDRMHLFLFLFPFSFHRSLLFILFFSSLFPHRVNEGKKVEKRE